MYCMKLFDSVENKLEIYKTRPDQSSDTRYEPVMSGPDSIEP
jgi:hypothetical protein